MKKFIQIILFLACNLTSFAHPIKMSTGKIEYLSNSHQFEITFHFFVDDFKTFLKDKYHLPDIDFNNPPDIVESYINEYIKSKVKLKVNGKPVELTFQKIHLLEENVVQVIFHFPPPENKILTLLEVYNELLFDAYSSQSNMLQLKFDEFMEPYLLRFFPGDAYGVFKGNYKCK